MKSCYFESHVILDSIHDEYHKSYQQHPWIRDICVSINNKVSKEEIAARRANGLVTTYYVCCADKLNEAKKLLNTL